MSSTKARAGALANAARPRIAVVGTGWWSTQHHIPALLSNELAELVAVVDNNPTRLRSAMDAYGLAVGVSDVTELLSSVELDGVVVATTAATHYEITKAVLETGAHAMVEKPMALRACEAWDLVKTAENTGSHLMVGYTHQFTDSARRLHEVVGSGGIGELVLISGLYASAVEEYYRGRPDAYRDVFDFAVTAPESTTYSDPAISGGGQAQTQLTHAIGMILWVSGRRVTEVSALMENTDLEVDLVDAISCRLDNGALGCLGSTGNLRAHAPEQQEIRYYGTEGFAIQDLCTATHQIFYAEGTSESMEVDDAGDPYPHFAPARGFADLISGRGPNRAPGELGARAVEFTEAAYESAAAKATIRLNLATDPPEATKGPGPIERKAHP